MFLADQRRARAETQKSLDPLRLPANSRDLLLADRKDLLGDGHAPYTLFEFGDYECPPCRGTQPQVTAMLKKYAGTVKMGFYNFPIEEIHPLALPAAEFAEAARLKGGGRAFWNAHDRLYGEELNRDALMRFSARAPREARAAVAADVALAARLGVNGTPTFVLCTPDGAVYKLPSLTFLEKFVH